EVLAEEVRRINPHVQVEAWNRRVTSEESHRFVEDADAVVDAIDVFAVDETFVLHREARARSLWIFGAQILGDIVSFCCFGPDAPSYESQLRERGNGAVNMRALTELLFPVLPAQIT